MSDLTNVVFINLLDNEAKLEETTELEESNIVTKNNITTISFDSESEPDDSPSKEDILQVSWTDEDGKKYRAIGGKYSYDEEEGKVTIKKLKIVPGIGIGFTGQLKIGPKDEITVNVNIGNRSNEDRDWIINFSDHADGAAGTSINLKALIDWIKGKTGDTDAEIKIPKVEGEEIDLKLDKFKVLFKKFEYNVTKKIFNFQVENESSDALHFGDFTLEKVGFSISNEPLAKKEKVENKKKEEEEDETENSED